MKPEFEEVLNEFGKRSTFPNSEHLASFWGKAEMVLGKFPDSEIWSVEPSDRKARWVVDTASTNAWYWFDQVKRIDALLFFHTVKLKTLLEAIETAIMENNLLVLALLVRSLFENCATLYVLAELIESSLSDFDLGKLDEQTVVNKDFEDKLIIFSHGSRFNWEAFAKGDYDAWMEAHDDVKLEHKQINIMTRISAVAKNRRYNAFTLLYGWLCDYVHPNIGSHLLYLRKETVEEGGNTCMKFARYAGRVDTMSFLQPFTGGLLSCLEITAEKPVLISSAIEPLKEWCKTRYIKYGLAARARRN